MKESHRDPNHWAGLRLWVSWDPQFRKRAWRSHHQTVGSIDNLSLKGFHSFFGLFAEVEFFEVIHR